MVLYFRVSPLNFAEPSVVMKNNAARNHALCGRASNELYSFKRPHALTCEGIHQAVKHQARNVALSKRSTLLRAKPREDVGPGGRVRGVADREESGEESTVGKSAGPRT